MVVKLKGNLNKEIISYYKVESDYMKKFLIILIGMCMLIFVSCTKNEYVYNKSVSQIDTITHYNIGGTENADRLLKFAENVEQKDKDTINIIKQTTEGDPIIVQLYFNGRDVEIAIDKSKDKFADKDKDKITYHTIKRSKNMMEDVFAYLYNNGL
jgi:hypothetical protein